MIQAVENLRIQHLYWRAGFGARPHDLIKPLSQEQAVAQLFQKSEANKPLRIELTGYNRDVIKKAALSGEERRKFMQKSRQDLLQINAKWLEQMAIGQEQFREKMTLFWHGHFACRTQRPDFALRQHNTLRQHALGKFSDLLLAISKDPAMLQFLNNQQNRKKQPNENFARELLELFTLGRGQYAEADIKNAARAFTGWGYNQSGEFIFREQFHDNGSKTILGKTGNFTGEDILQIILDKPQTAQFITTKIYKFFVNEKPDTHRINTLAKQFYNSGYNITALMKEIFSADWFYAKENSGNKIKSPVELLAGMNRVLVAQIKEPKALVAVQKVLGQVLLVPPNVGGWPGGRNWIDSSSLLFRMKLPQVLFGDASLNIALKDDENDTLPMMQGTERIFNRRVEATADWQPLHTLFSKISEKELTAQLSQFLLQAPIALANLKLLQERATKIASKSDKIKVLSLAIMSLPEYQLA